MDLKNALAVCLISLVSATLVLLLARALDLQAARRLEPQLVRIVEELEAIRKQGGGVVPAADRAANSDGDPSDLDNGLLVYYFHGETRCPTCRSIESQAHAALETQFAGELERGEIVWKMLNYEGPDGAALATEFDVLNAVVVLALRRDGKLVKWRRLDEVWGVVGDPPEFAELMENEVRKMLTPEGGAAHEGEES
jgi:hypothetical protein